MKKTMLVGAYRVTIFEGMTFIDKLQQLDYFVSQTVCYGQGPSPYSVASVLSISQNVIAKMIENEKQRQDALETYYSLLPTSS